MTKLANECAAEAEAAFTITAPGDIGPNRPTSTRLRHAVTTSFDQVCDLHHTWDALVDEVGGDIYSTYDWCSLWWHHYGRGRRLQIHLFHENEQLIGVLPLFCETLRLGLLSLRLVRLVGCDHSVTTCAPVIRSDRMAKVISAVIEHLDRTCSWDLLHFGPLPGYYTERSALAEALRGCHSAAEVFSSGDDGPHVLFDLPDSYEEYLAGISSSERRNIRKRELRFDKKHRRGVVIVAPEDVDDAFCEFVRQHQDQWRHQGQLGHFGDWPGAQAYHHDMAVAQSRRGRLMLLRLGANGECLGFQYSYRFGQRVHWILTSRALDPKWDCYSPGRLLHCVSVGAAIDWGATQIDGLRGMYDYKLRLGGSVLQLQSVSVIHQGLMRRSRVSAARFNARLLDLLYYRIWFSRLAPRFPYLQRPLWRLWIRSRI